MRSEAIDPERKNTNGTCQRMAGFEQARACSLRWQLRRGMGGAHARDMCKRALDGVRLARVDREGMRLLVLFERLPRLQLLSHDFLRRVRRIIASGAASCDALLERGLIRMA